MQSLKDNYVTRTGQLDDRIQQTRMELRNLRKNYNSPEYDNISRESIESKKRELERLVQEYQVITMTYGNIRNREEALHTEKGGLENRVVELEKKMSTNQ
jgi:hypothetical protein